ncbi:PadR family transcriptional regulator [Microlunatus soli]|uniref:PadR family transcriptional regulator n=1 Tax=Microlunatus soli TaxID=630515 RepID=UPI0012FB3423|nr:helix-turn-helix transcriptional regulator [Microlunatus soli]
MEYLVEGHGSGVGVTSAARVKLAARVTPLGAAVLALLAERPMHPYQMFSVLMERRQDRLVKIRAGSLYHTVERLARDGLLEVTGTERAGARPERTMYALADAGTVALEDWVRRTMSEPEPEFPRFPLALAEAHNLSVDTVVGLLTEYLQIVETDIDAYRTAIEQLQKLPLPEAHWLEIDYLLAQRSAERDWIATTLKRLQSKDLPWPK